MKRGLFIVLFIGLIILISGQQACEPVVQTGQPIQSNTCCKLSSDTRIDCINDLSVEGCDSLFLYSGINYNSEVFNTDFANSCNDVCNTQDLSCVYQNTLYRNGALYSLNNKIYQCINSAWVEGTGCTPNCIYSSECAETGTDVACGSICTRDTDNNICSIDSNAGKCSNELCNFYISVISVSQSNSCAVLSDNKVKCWGRNNMYQLGDGSQTTRTTPVEMLGATGAKGVSTGNQYTCVLFAGGNIKCIGYNFYGQLGGGTTVFSSGSLVSVVGINNAVKISSGVDHTCALLSDKTIKCWGNNAKGQIGDGSLTNRNSPVSVSGINNAVDVVAGMHYTCALLKDRTVKCWGNNANGQLGDGTIINKNYPVQLIDTNNNIVNNVVMIAPGDNYTCALLSDKTIKCWGFNGGGQLGYGFTSGTLTRLDPSKPVSGINNAIRVSSGSSHSCALLEDYKTVKCWGSDSNGQLGNSDILTNSNVPIVVSGISADETVFGFKLSYAHNCVILNDGTKFKCWGFNSNGQLGDGTTANKESATLVLNLP